MAEVVRQVLERMAPELEDYREKKLFSDNELRKLVKQRSDFEYAMRRKVPIKMDFLRAIEFEMNLDQMRRARKEIKGPFKKSTVSDFAVTKRIHFLFERALRKFTDDLDLWDAAVDFGLKSEAKRSLGKLLTWALQVHPREVRFWVKAALWESEGQNNVTAARTMFQRGLRINPSSSELWHRFFGMEVSYVLKMIERKRVLGLLKDKIDAENTEIASRDARTRGSQPDADSSDADEADPETAALRKREEALLGGILPRAIFDSAMQSTSLTVDFDFCAGFLSFVPPGVSHLAGLRQHVLQTAAVRFGVNTPAAADLVAKHRLEEALASAKAAEERPAVLEIEQPAFDAFEVTVRAAEPGHVAAVWELYADHALDRSRHYERLHAMLRREATLFQVDGAADRKRKKTDSEEDLPPASEEATLAAATAAHMLRKAQEVCQRAVEAVEPDHGAWVRLQTRLVRSYQHAGDRAKAREAGKAATDGFAGSTILWRLRLNLEREAATEAHESAATKTKRRRGRAGDAADPSGRLASLVALYQEALAAVPRAEAMPLWLDYLELHRALADEAVRGNAAAESDESSSSDDSSDSSDNEDDREQKRASRSVKQARAAFCQAVASGCDDEEGRLKCAYVQWAASVEGRRGAEEAVRYVTRTNPPNALPVFLACVRALESVGAEPKRMRAVFESAIGEHGKTSGDLWMEFARLEGRLGTAGGVTKVHWRAKRTLTDGPREAFLARFQTEIALGQQ